MDYQRPIMPWEQPTAVIPKSAEQQMMEDAAVAYETAKARLAKPRYIAPGVNLDSDAAIDREVYTPFRRAWGIPDQYALPPKLFEIGGSVVAANPHTGETHPVYTSTPPPAKPKTHKFEMGQDTDLRTKTGDFTVEDFAKQWDTLPDFAKKSAINQAYLRGAGYDPTTGKLLAVAAPTVEVPNPFNRGRISFTRNGVTTSQDLGKSKRPTRAVAADYVTRYGRSGAAEALLKEGYDLSGYAD